MDEADQPSLGREIATPRAIFAALNAREVDFLVIGGLAVIAYGYPRTTQDVDILPSPDAPNMRRLAAALSDLGATAAGTGGARLPLDLSHPESLALGKYFLDTVHGGLDLVNGPRPDLKRYHRLAASAVEIELTGARMRVISKDDLIEMKREAGRPKDLRDIAALTELERNPGPPLDM